MEENKQTVKEVYKAIVAVQGDMAALGIGKNSKNQQQGFMFRGIDAVYNALAPLLAKHKLCILPRQMSRNKAERESKSGGALFDVDVVMEYDLVSSVDGSMHTIRMGGEAMDSGDKATNKAESAAYKYACFQTFCIPTEGESPDADKESHEVKGKPQAAGGDQPGMIITKIREVVPTSNPKFCTIVTVEDRKMGTGDINLITIAKEVIKTGEEVRLHFETNGRFTDLTDIERRKHEHQPAGSMSPSTGHKFAVGIVETKVKVKTEGYLAWTISNQQLEDGSDMKFATKDPALQALMDDAIKNKTKVRVEFMPPKTAGNANIIHGVRSAALDEVPF